jgi:hypothetical protein
MAAMPAKVMKMSRNKQPKQKFNAQTAIPKRQVLKQAAFTKKDLSLIEQAMRTHKAAGGRGIMVGGSALRFYMGPRFTGKMGRAARIDFAFTEIPKSIRGNLMERVWMGSRFFCWNPKRMPKMEDVRIFEGEVGHMPLEADEFALANIFRIHDGQEEGELRIADLGFLLATMINKDATAPPGVAYAIASNAGQMDSLAQRYVEVMECAGAGRKEIEEALCRFAKKAKTSIRHFAEEFAVKAKEKIGMWDAP